MPTPITFPNITANQLYCQYSDVENLIGSTVAFKNLDESVVTNKILSSQEYINNGTHKKFSPFRVLEAYDGSGTNKIVLKNSPLIVLNSVNIYYQYPMPQVRLCNDWEYITDRNTGTVTFPLSNVGSPFFYPYAFNFFRGSRNVTVDAMYGFTEVVFGEVLTTTNNLTYSFADNCVSYGQNTTYDTTMSPQLYPLIYINGVLVKNNTYELINAHWQYDEMNLVYVIDANSNGIASVTFNEPQLGNVITADYPYWYIKADIVEACAKKAALELLTSFGTSLYSTDDDTISAADGVQLRNNKITYISGPWATTINRWQSDVDKIIKNNKAIQVPFGMNY
jgi:hypothetical protein